MNVQGWVADDLGKIPADEAYEAVTCSACMRMHLVNPKNGKVLGADED
jgi:hypothetical protein